MTHSIDASFRLKKQALAARRARARLRKAFAALAILVTLAIAAAFYYTADHWRLGEDYDEDLRFAEDAGEIPAEAPVYIPAIVDLPGDPMWISLSKESASASRVSTLARPAALDRFGVSPEIHLLSDAMLSSSERFMTTIPSTQEDFAFFQAQRTVSPMPSTAPAELEGLIDPLASEPDGSGSEAAGWDETISAGEAELPHFQKTEIENNTTVATVTPEPERIEATRDFFIKVLVSRSIDSIVLEEGFSAEDAKLAGEALKSVFARDGVQPGDVVALRGSRAKRDVKVFSLMQVSIYTGDVFVGTLARNAAGAFVSSVDPWVRDDLFNYSGEPKDVGLKRQYRLLDAIYSTAARNNVPTAVIGEAIMYLSRGQDLNSFATHRDRLVLIYGSGARGEGGAGGRVLYVGVLGGEKPLECFVYEQSDGEHACVSGDERVHSLTLTNGMATPVNGVMTSTFGPRKHPILKTVRIHKGVDWAAPVGTPIVAAYDGEIVFQGDGGGYGNLVRVAHEGGRETRYAHLQRFERESGAVVKAGDVIGYVGTTGLSTGPHLHFELYLGGEAIDPLASPTLASVSVSDGSAVEILTDRIIQVESGGNARAKNPLSSATGLGQFIDSTWIRMMNTYRPDLARSLSRAEQLALRFDVTISREMVSNLAREGEAYLRARGHTITAGRLYLCHFLGMEGAHKVLAAPSNIALIDALGAGVIRANPFLTGKDVGYVLSWAERKMTGRGRRPAAQPVTVTTQVTQPTSPEFEKYKAAIAQLVQPEQRAL
jgi:murein DD-endopeptidase MepM/ murein hydrolase activator NlpD